MISNKLLVANLMIGLTILFQGLVPMRHISKFEGFWMFSAGVTCMVFAVITFIGLLIMSRSKCIQTMGKIKLLIFHSTAIVTTLLSLIFFIVYAFVPIASAEHAAIQNAVLLLVVASGLVFLSTSGILLMALLSAPEIPSERDDDD
ncbi:hypothetical protein L3Y34_001918 [Caenorhabditis briggsae]|uniref:Uncharacterized protein n=3 Tax=Caenorhabditis briggsae TaxID=6238 RepID=A0AAE9DEF4_CAEBR|nr:hypothetical protein L3Y34_001918 [Caenorhabditis briggsae]